MDILGLAGVRATPLGLPELERRGGGGGSRRIQLPGATRIILRWNSGSRTGNAGRLEHRRLPVVVFCCSEVNSSAGRARRRVRSRKKQEQSKASLDVEREIFQFMQQSPRPNAFPSKEDLLEAGRSDLVDAIVDQGGHWLAVRWETIARKPEVNGHASSRVSRKLLKDPSSPPEDDPVPRGIRKESCADHQRTPPKVDDSGNKDFEGSLTTDGSAGTEQSDSPTASPKHRRAKFRERFDTSELDAALQRARAEILSFKELSSRRNAPDGRESGESVKNRELPATLELALERAQAKTGKDLEGEGEERNRERRRKKRLEETESRRTGESSVNTALDWVKDMVSKREELIQQLRSKSSDASPATSPDLRLAVKPRSRETTTTSRARTRKGEQSAPSSTDKPALSDTDSSFAGRVRRLEDKLLATRAALKSGRTALLKGEDRLMQVQRRTSEEFAKATDTLEFRESEIMQTRAELRRTRAQVIALQARYGVELSEARKEAEEKQALLDRAERALRMLRLVRIVWPNPASQVLLSGSFDGWTNKIPMERSGAGVFVTSLQLYPGRYEIKFVVDGTWRVDPCRPITYSDGIENNVLMLS